MSECNHTFRTEERPARIDCCIHCGALEPVVTIATMQARTDTLTDALVKAGKLALNERWDTRFPLIFGMMEKAMEAEK